MPYLEDPYLARKKITPGFNPHDSPQIEYFWMEYVIRVIYFGYT